MSQEFDTFVVEDVRSLLFGARRSGHRPRLAQHPARPRPRPADLQRACASRSGSTAKTSFAQVTSDPGDRRAAVARPTAATSASSISTSAASPRIRSAAASWARPSAPCMIDQFTRLRDGDPFWSQGRGFGAAELDALWATTLSDVIRRNSGVIGPPGRRLPRLRRVARQRQRQHDHRRLRAQPDHRQGRQRHPDRRRLATTTSSAAPAPTGSKGRAGANTLVGGTGGDTFVIHVDRDQHDDDPGLQRAGYDRVRECNSAGVPAMTVTDGPKGAIVRFGAATDAGRGRARGRPAVRRRRRRPGVTLNGDGKARTC